MTAFAILFTMAAIGIAETSYLIRTRRMGQKAICPIGGGCQVVLESKYSHLFGVKNDVLGFVFYVSSAILCAFMVLEFGPIALWQTVVTAMIVGAALMSLFFTYLQAFVLKHWCFWCVMSACTVLVMAIIAALNFQLP